LPPRRLPILSLSISGGGDEGNKDKEEYLLWVGTLDLQLTGADALDLQLTEAGALDLQLTGPAAAAIAAAVAVTKGARTSMMKNRESALRSKARKKTHPLFFSLFPLMTSWADDCIGLDYTTYVLLHACVQELEKEVRRLVNENLKL